LNLPFSISDLLERVIPGGIFLLYVAVAFAGTDILIGLNTWTVSSIIVAASLAYAVGVMLNALASLTNLGDNRIYWAKSDNGSKLAVKQSIADYFEIEPDESSWKVCYGICAKHGYAANTQLFQGLFVFCRSMCVNCILGALLIFISQIIQWLEKSSIDQASVWICVASALSAVIFYKGVRTYTRSFVGSIYEGFYTWHRENHKGNP
jgi:zinc transporter ZupT